jgi:hypothetical protein
MEALNYCATSKIFADEVLRKRRELGRPDFKEALKKACESTRNLFTEIIPSRYSFGANQLWKAQFEKDISR